MSPCGDAEKWDQILDFWGHLNVLLSAYYLTLILRKLLLFDVLEHDAYLVIQVGNFICGRTSLLSSVLLLIQITRSYQLERASYAPQS